MTEEQVVEFIPLIGFEDDYEILNQCPFTIRKKLNHREVSESINGRGYIQVHLNGKTYLKHKLISEQFIPNPDNLPCIDHINHDRSDYRLINLRWISYSENSKNRSSCNGIEYTYVDEISDESIVVNDYGHHHFENYYYDEAADKFFFYNGVQYRELHVNEKKNGILYIQMYSTENKRVQIYISKFKKLYGLN